MLQPISTPSHTNPVYFVPILEYIGIFSKIFSFLEQTPLQMSTLALVSREWHQMASSPNLWSEVCRQIGIPLPLNLECSQQACRYEKSSLFLEEVKACHALEIEEIELPEGILEHNPYVKFIEDRFLVVQNSQELVFYDLNNPLATAKTIQTDERILSFCWNRRSIYIALASQHILVYSISLKSDRLPAPSQETREEPPGPHFDFLTILDGHNEEVIFSRDGIGEFLMWANDKWLITRSTKTIKKWDTATHICIRTETLTTFYESNPIVQKFGPNSLLNDYYSLTLVQNKIYSLIGRCVGLLDEDHYCLLYSDLDSEKFSLTDLGLISKIVSKLDIYNSTCSWITQSIEHQEDMFISKVNLKSKEIEEMRIPTVGMNKLISLKTINGLVVLARDGYDPEREYETITEISDCDILELIDLKNRKRLHCIQRDFIYTELDNNWAISTFQGALLYLTEKGHVVRIKFPPNKKRELEDKTKEEPSSKRAKIDFEAK